MVGFGNIAAGGPLEHADPAIHRADAMRGRVMAIYTAMFIGAIPVGSLLTRVAWRSGPAPRGR
jgi:hypothetical protein